jgi:hypothetical protein
MKLLTFGDYNIPGLQRYSDNFNDVVQRTVRRPGLDGGFDLWGAERLPKEVGSIQASWWLQAGDVGAMRGLLDEVKGLQWIGEQRLVMDPEDGTATRFANAKVINIRAPWNVANAPHRQIRVDVSFQCAEPYWQTLGTGAPRWGQFRWGDGSRWGGGTPVTVTGASTDLTVTVGGNAPTFANVVLQQGGGTSCENPTIQRIKDGVAVDEVAYAGTLSGTNQLVIDARANAVTLDGADAFGALTFTRNHWLLLEPGDNTIRVQFDNGGDESDVTVRFVERWN